MRFYALNPNIVDAFQASMLNSGWTISKQDAGQAHLVGWGYMIQWHKQQQSVQLHFKDVQGQAEAQLEMTPDAWPEIEQIIQTLL